MDKEFDIEVQEENVENINSTQLPMNFLTFGEIENDDVKVYIKQDVYKALEKLSASDTSKELGSIIVGDYCQDLGKTNVIVSNFIEAKYTDASASTLTFTHETWDYIHSEHERLYPEKKIIGWQHTHPNYGIFLSNYDMFIQENFFNLPFQIAYVIDPIQNIRGFFQWKNGKIEKLKGFYVYEDVGKPIKIEQTKVESKSMKTVNMSKLIYVLVSILCIVCLLLGLSLLTLKKDYQERLDEQEKIVSNIHNLLRNQSTVIENQEEEIASLDLIVNNQNTKLSNQAETIDELKTLLESKKDVKFVSYVVGEGDSLFSICAKYELDYPSNKNIILAINGVKNPDKIYVGQRLLLPTTNDNAQ